MSTIKWAVIDRTTILIQTFCVLPSSPYHGAFALEQHSHDAGSLSSHKITLVTLA